jgi:hypothetical protein
MRARSDRITLKRKRQLSRMWMAYSRRQTRRRRGCGEEKNERLLNPVNRVIVRIDGCFQDKGSTAATESRLAKISREREQGSPSRQYKEKNIPWSGWNVVMQLQKWASGAGSDRLEYRTGSTEWRAMCFLRILCSGSIYDTQQPGY